MKQRCEAVDCEGWALEPGDRFCSNCGLWLQPLDLIPEILVGDRWIESRVLDGHPARLRLVFRGREGSLDLSELQLPGWLEVDPLAGVLEAGQSVSLALRVREQPREGLPGWVRLGEAELQIWCSAPAQAQLVWSPRLLNPEKSEIQGELCLREGALFVDALPVGWTTEEPLPTVLSVRSRPTMSLSAPAVEGDVNWPLGPLEIKSVVHCRWAGQLVAPLRQEWCLTRFDQIDVPVEARQGPVEIESVQCSVAQAEFPARLEGQGCIRLTLESAAEPGSTELRVVLGDGRERLIHLDLIRRPLTPFPGWLLVDFGGSASAAALAEDDGRLTQLTLDHSSLYLPSGIAYFPGGRSEVTDLAGPHVVLEAKRNLGRGDFCFRLTLPETGEVLERTPRQAAQDYFGLLLERIRPHLGLHRVERCCLTHPAAFSPRQVEELRQAWLANLDCQLECISEPLAAAYFYLSRRTLPARSWRLLLYDFGGTTSDVAVLQVDSQVRTMVTAEIEHVGGDRWFGGQDITECVAQSLPPEQGHWAETVKRNYSLPEPLPLPPEVPAPPRGRVDAEVEPHLRLSLPQPSPKPDLIVISGRGSHYPLIGEWLQRQFPGVPLERCSQPKDCVVLGARLHPEVVRSAGPRSLGDNSNWLHFPERPARPVCTTRLGVKVVGDQGARFQSMVALGQSLPCQVELSPLSLLAGSNRLDIVENLGTDDAYLLPDGQSNGHLVTLDHQILHLDHAPDPASTRLRWELGADYRLRVTVLVGDQQILQVVPFSLWRSP